MIAIGIDPSLTGTGVAFWDGETWRTARFPSAGKKDATLGARRMRQHGIASRVWERFAEWGIPETDEYEGVPAPTPDCVVTIERMNYQGLKLGSPVDRAANMLGLADLVWDYLGVWPVEVQTTSLKLIGSGYGKASKDDMIRMAERVHGLVLKSDDEADAVALADIAARLLGSPSPGSPEKLDVSRAASFAKVQATYDALIAERKAGVS